MGHDNVGGLVQREVVVRGQFGNCLIDPRFVQRSQVLEVLAGWCVSVAGERIIDGSAHTLDNVVVHGSSARWVV
jgi:hypothetical protein